MHPPNGVGQQAHPENEPNPEVILKICFLPEIRYDAAVSTQDDADEPEVLEPRRKVAKKPVSANGGGYMGYDLSGRKPAEGHGKKFYSLKKEMGLE